MNSICTNDRVELLRRLRRTPDVLVAVATAAVDSSELQLQQTLRRRFPAELVRAALTLRELRCRARCRFARADEMWFDRIGLEQATGSLVARHTAQRFTGEVCDWCCGIGGNTIALAARGPVEALDQDAAKCLMTEWNTEAWGVRTCVTVTVADVTTLAATGRLVHIDPDQRAGRQLRSRRVEDCVPDLAFLSGLIRSARGGAIKLSPAANLAGRFPGCETELISVDGECKQASIWFGELRGTHDYSASVLPSGARLCGHPLDALTQVKQPGGWVYDPDPAIVRAGLLDVLCEQTELARLDAADEYLTSEQRVDSPFARRFKLSAILPGNERQIRRYFRQHPAGEVEIKCRHLPIQADALRRTLTRTGRGRITLIMARVDGRSRALVCRRAERSTD